MDDSELDQLTEAEVHALFERLFPAGVTGQDVLDEIAPEGWERSPFVACFHASVDASTVIRQNEEVRELVGCCLWDIVSDNHDIIAPDGRLVIIGSWRHSASLIADHVMGQGDGRDSYDYMLFYMGTFRHGRHADLTPVHAMIFRRMAALGWDWRYTFPQLYLVQIAPVEPVAPPPRPEVDEEGARARADAADREPPDTVRAYRQIHGRDPWGWPPA